MCSRSRERETMTNYTAARFVPLVLASSILWIATPRAVVAQTRRSTIVAGVANRDTGEPLVGAEVVLPDLDRSARANALGEAVLPGVPLGRAQLRVRRIGYAPAEAQVMVSGDTVGVVFRLERLATKLGDVEVEAERLLPALRDVEVR